MREIAADSGATLMQFAELKKELFHPSDSTNAATDDRLVELAKVAAQGILDELHDKKSDLEIFVHIGISHVLSRMPEGGQGGITWA